MIPISTCQIIRLEYVSFYMPSSDVLELDDVLYVPSLTKCLISVSCMTDLQCLAKFDG
jgi:hypothetical protein